MSVTNTRISENMGTKKTQQYFTNAFNNGLFWVKGGVYSFFNKLTRLKIIPDRDLPMALLFGWLKGQCIFISVAVRLNL